jgi:quinol-cytochrome oxidoreductase complex cytochrome b subunit
VDFAARGIGMPDRNNDKKFFPYYFFEIMLVAVFTVEVVLILAVLFPPPIGREIDFSAQYSPRPEWYFLFLYQLTKYFSGEWTFVGAVLLPGLAFSALLLAPFLDSGKATDLRQRKTAAAAGLILLALVIGLTVLSLI